MTPIRRRLAHFAFPLVVFLAAVAPAAAQGPHARGMFQPLDSRMRPGLVADWSARSGRLGNPRRVYFQPVEVRLSETGEQGGGRVTWYIGPHRQPLPAAAPAVAGLQVGAVYRLKISDMGDFPGVSLYPTVEIIDRLHPPRGQRYRFPVPVELTGEDIRLALTGRLVTRVVFLEEPRLSGGHEKTTPMMVRELPVRVNLLSEADRVGRPMVIVRLGSRLPPTDPAAAAVFLGTGAPLELPGAPPAQGRSSRRRGPLLPRTGRLSR